MLTPENYTKGMLIDDQLMAGVSAEAEAQGFAAFVINHSTGEYLAYQTYPELEMALSSINQIPRSWKFEASGGCGNGSCGEDGPCGKGPCQQGCQLTGTCEYDAHEEPQAPRN